ncbi:hypothetical protein QA645_41985 [Bradyrhizobium sp. CIAT3101]|uniref:hypothetical protein n=1 Tax=Bradyrhizobium sp. CIAT3101 TaxID=439387 RepID=UPI0024B155DB|nr:hypothetical protein [Bradyrhizobium sp. CIAT3101]WFU80911.1 hypothetical protein QA645_41985 [Bradyrhizobium sp. CIAT3101]
MEWVLFIGLCAFAYYRVRRAREKADEYAAAGLARSPLYWSTAALTVTLLGLSLYMAHLGHEGPIPWPYWSIVVVLFVVILLLRRALRWRYPI